MDKHIPKKPKTTTPTPVMNDGFVEVTRKGKEKHASKPRHIDGVRLTKPKPNYFYCPVGKSVNVHGEASTSQPKKMVHTNTNPASNKVSSKCDDINIISLKNSFDALKEEDDVLETNKSDWQKSNNSESTFNDSDSEEVENVFVEDNGKPIDGLVDDARKKVEAPPKKTPRKTGIWSGRKADSPKKT
ncbi:hypothetical protein Tco_1574368 [Tanacetum coccineum]